MVISSIKVGGYANIEQATVYDTTSSAFVAPNNYGKSNMLAAIEFGTRFISASDNEKRRMMQDLSKMPINKAIEYKDFSIDIEGICDTDEAVLSFKYGYSFAWEHDGASGEIRTEYLKVKHDGEAKFRLIVTRTATGSFVCVPSVTGRCNKKYQISGTMLAINQLYSYPELFYASLLQQLVSINIPYLNTLDNPNIYFSLDGRNGVDLLDGRTISEYLYKLKTQDSDNYGLLENGIMQLLPNLESFEPTEISLGNGMANKVYDIRVKERTNSHATSIRQMSSGSKRVIYILTMCMVANVKSTPMLLIEEPENSIHPRLLQKLLTCMRGLATDTKVVMTSHSTYLMRYFDAGRIYLGLPNEQGLATFARLKSGKEKAIYRRANEMDITFGEYMYELLLDMEDNPELAHELFQK